MFEHLNALNKPCFIINNEYKSILWFLRCDFILIVQGDDVCIQNNRKDEAIIKAHP